MRYKKWRDLSVDLFEIKYKNFNIIEILSYLPAGNDVVECLIKGKKNNDIQNAFIKYERSKVADFKTESKNIKKIKNCIKEVPNIIEFGHYNNKDYIVLSKINGSRLSEIFKRSTKYKKDYLINYGETLGRIHQIHNNNFNKALQRPINEIATCSDNLDEFPKKIIKWLKKNDVKKDYNTFIHGDFHYGNVLFKNRKVTGIIDFEYSGLGFKEQDIAWACILRPGQIFMNNITDIKHFLNGYKNINEFDMKKFVWCYINGSIHFYLMNVNNKKYILKIKKMINCFLSLKGGIL